MTKICRKLKNVEITEDDDYEDNSDLKSFEPVSCMEYPEQLTDPVQPGLFYKQARNSLIN